MRDSYVTAAEIGRLGVVSNLIVENGSTLQLTSDIFNGTEKPEVHISGTGKGEAGAALVFGAAGNVNDHTHIVLDGDATISNGGTVWF